MRKWRIEDSEELYNITGWGTSYFGINDKGHVVVTPRKDGVSVDLKELVDELQLRDVASPMLVRFQDGSSSFDNRRDSRMIGSDESSQHFGQYVESAPLVVCQDVDRICLAEYRFCFSSNFNFQVAG